MLAKLALLVLVFFAVIAWVGKWRVKLWPDRKPRIGVKRCPDCGAPLAGDTGCPCGWKS